MVFVRRLLLAVVFLGVIALALVVPTSNAALVSLGIDAFDQSWRLPDLPLWIVVGVAYFLGIGTASAALTWKIMKQALAGRRYRKTVAGLESEIHQLRNLPLEGADAVGTDPALAAPSEEADAKREIAAKREIGANREIAAKPEA